MLSGHQPSSSNLWVIDELPSLTAQRMTELQQCKQVVPRASVEDGDDTCRIRIAIGALSQTYQLDWYTKYAH